jgi:hypothetical protein
VLHGQCNQGRLVDALRDLLSLYYQPNETAEMRARQIALFVKDLADMSDATVHWAVDEWRRTMDRRPTPASLRQLCMVRRAEATNALARRQPPEPAPTFQISDEERAGRRAQVEQIMRETGFAR